MRFMKATHHQKPYFLVLRLRKLQKKYDMILHLIHISDSSMIACGINGLSRIPTEGVITGNHLLQYVPLNVNCL